MKRRDFLKAVALTTPGLIATACSTPLKIFAKKETSDLDASRSPAATPKGLRVRHEASSAEGKANLATYAKAVGIMKAEKPIKNGKTNGLSWENQALVHLHHCPHGTWNFFPWHREYLLRFEEIIRTVAKDDNFTLPYWDWSANPSLPVMFKKDDSPLNTNDKSREGSISKAVKEVASSTICGKILKSNDFDTFMGSKDSSGQVEIGPHNGIHAAMGALGSPMGDFKSPLDPIFWLHHCNVDRLWAEWQDKNLDWREEAKIKTHSPEWLKLPLQGFFDITGKAITKKRFAADVIDTFDLKYAYTETKNRHANVGSIGLARSIASASGWHNELRAFTRDGIQAKIGWNKEMNVCEVEFPDFRGNAEKYLDAATKEPTDFDNWTFRLRVLNFPKISRNTIMRMNFNIPTHAKGSASEFFLTHYCFFLPSQETIDSMEGHAGHHSSPFVPDFNFDFSLLLAELHNQGFESYPDATKFTLEFVEPLTMEGQTVKGFDFSKLEFKVSVLEKVPG